ncbi:zf-HC2 domain-containing protein [Rivibacter subsaxonicus]|uniref:Putative zinc finger protein n=1 Tax=Rivibacter subsaxonicus TaxID=457575 RepID=A0A4Q7VNM9_9BURK|nr:zf-HC2 domain-containing protein [Rivibacter subsaxonicus]RZT97929.1 putative zinc finger protein [Rivibacter subsaxonicus]
MYPRLTCKQASRLITSRFDRTLPLGARVSLRLHLLICKACPTFERQLKLMNGAMGRWRSYADDGEQP